jgi:hypothetical protein
VSNPYTADTVYNTTLSPTLEMLSDVGGISSGTVVSDLTGKTFVEIFDDLLFPTLQPTYDPADLSITWTLGGSTQYKEVGESVSLTVTGTGTKNDAGTYTQIRLYTDNSVTNTETSLTNNNTTNVGDIDNFGQTNPNDPNISSVATFSKTVTVSAPSSSDRSLLRYKVDGNFGQGLKKNNNKGVEDSRSFGSGVNSPQSSGTKTTGNLNLYGIYPYFYGTSDSQPTSSDIVSTIESQSGGSGITYNKGPISSSGRANGDLQLTFGTNGQIKYLWFAIWDGYDTYTDWYATNNSGTNNGTMSDLFESVSVNQITEGSATSLWTENYKIYITLYDTEQANGGYTFTRT